MSGYDVDRLLPPSEVDLAMKSVIPVTIVGHSAPTLAALIAYADRHGISHDARLITGEFESVGLDWSDLP